MSTASDSIREHDNRIAPDHNWFLLIRSWRHAVQYGMQPDSAAHNVVVQLTQDTQMLNQLHTTAPEPGRRSHWAAAPSSPADKQAVVLGNLRHLVGLDSQTRR